MRVKTPSKQAQTRNRQAHIPRVTVGLLVLMTLACNFLLPAEPSPAEAGSNLATQMTKTTSTEVPLEQLEPTLTLVPASPTPSSSGKQAKNCVPLQDGVQLPSVRYEELPAAITDFLNQGGSPEALALELQTAMLASQPFGNSAPPPVRAADMTRDGVQDIVVAIANPASSFFPTPGDLLIYLCQEKSYQLIHQRASEEFQGGPQLWYLQDLNADQRADLVVSYPSCGAHTCFENVQIIVWNREVFENRLQGGSVDLPYPQINLDGPDQNGLYSLLVTGTGFGSVGAGPPRPWTRAWSFIQKRGNWEITDEYSGDSKYRIHILHDADQLAQAGDYSAALEGYQHVIDNPDLINGMQRPLEWESLAAYARFRILAIYLIQGQNDLAQVQYEALASAHPAGEGLHSFVEMSDLFQQAFPTSGATGGCQAVRAYIEGHSDQILPIFEYGYGNPVYSAQEICPW